MIMLRRKFPALNLFATLQCQLGEVPGEKSPANKKGNQEKKRAYVAK
jgi:hypothetical protein